jgi:DNA modification methylase
MEETVPENLRQDVVATEIWPIERIVAYARNPRKNDSAIERMAAAISEFGFKIPVLVRGDGELVDGHLRLKAARKLGMRDIPVIRCDEWTPSQVKAFRLLVNRSADWADWDEQLLALEMADLKAVDFDLSFTGFDPLEIDSLLFSGEIDARADELPDAKETVVSRLGDLWICGKHRILCGDATDGASVERLLQAGMPHLMITDPPYGIQNAPQWRERVGLGAQRQTGISLNDDCFDWTAAYRLFTGDVAYVWHAGVHAGPVSAGLMNCGFEIRGQIIWAKPHFVISRGHYHWQHEPCFYAVRNGKPAHWRGDRTQSTLWEVASLNPFGGPDAQETATGHSAQKPVELMRRPILNHSERGELIYDPFLGSGTTIIAAELTERICYGLEIAPQYVDLIIRRWQLLTGRSALLETDGRTFDEIGAERSLTDARASRECE